MNNWTPACPPQGCGDPACTELCDTPALVEHSTDSEWIIRLGESFGELCAEYRQGAGAGVDEALDALIRLGSEWRQERSQ